MFKNKVQVKRASINCRLYMLFFLYSVTWHDINVETFYYSMRVRMLGVFYMRPALQVLGYFSPIFKPFLLQIFSFRIFRKYHENIYIMIFAEPCELAYRPDNNAIQSGH